MRIAYYLILTVGTVALLAQPALAETHSTHSLRAHRKADAYRHPAAAAATPPQLADPRFYGPFGGYAEANAAAQYSGPNERRYFGYGGADSRRAALDGLVAQAASANGVPASLVHRVIMRESRYNPRAVNGGNYGLMQIRLGTARAMGYAGSAAGLLDAETNMSYAVRYLAGAYRAAGGNETHAVALYARGY